MDGDWTLSWSPAGPRSGLCLSTCPQGSQARGYLTVHLHTFLSQQNICLEDDF